MKMVGRLEPKTQATLFYWEGAGTNDDLTENNNVFISIKSEEKYHR
jgi:hypothetical protein